MSKQSDAKQKQGYVSKAVPQTCMTCANFKSDISVIPTTYGTYSKESNVRCGTGGFAVKKMGTCEEWKGKVTE